MYRKLPVYHTIKQKSLLVLQTVGIFELSMERPENRVTAVFLLRHAGRNGCDPGLNLLLPLLGELNWREATEKVKLLAVAGSGCHRPGELAATVALGIPYAFSARSATNASVSAEPSNNRILCRTGAALSMTLPSA